MWRPRVWFTVRRMMTAVAVVALVCLVVIAVMTGPDSEPRGGAAQSSSTQVEPEFKEGPIEEISLVRFPGLTYRGQYQEVVIQRDGTVTRHEFGTWDGMYRDETLHGSIGSKAFQDLESLLGRQQFFSMKRLGYPMDSPYVELKASNKSGVTRVTGQKRNHLDDSPGGFNEIVATIDQLVAQVQGWK
jgi:hypothetical protein